MQIGLFRGDEGSSHEWYLDEESLPQSNELKNKQHRLLTMMVQLQASSSYDDGDFNVASEALGRVQGDAYFFPSYALQKVDPVSSGTRVALVAWAVGHDNETWWSGQLDSYRSLAAAPKASVSDTAKLEELSKTKFTALRKRAVAAGLDSAVLEELLDSDDPKSALAEQIVALESSPDTVPAAPVSSLEIMAQSKLSLHLLARGLYREAVEVTGRAIKVLEAQNPIGDRSAAVSKSLSTAAVRLAIAYAGDPSSPAEKSNQACAKALKFDPTQLSAIDCHQRVSKLNAQKPVHPMPPPKKKEAPMPKNAPMPTPPKKGSMKMPGDDERKKKNAPKDSPGSAMVSDMDFAEMETHGRKTASPPPCLNHTMISSRCARSVEVLSSPMRLIGGARLPGELMGENKLHEASYFFLQAISLDPGRNNPGYKRVEALWSAIPPPPTLRFRRPPLAPTIAHPTALTGGVLCWACSRRETSHAALKKFRKLGSPKLQPGGSGTIKNGKVVKEDSLTDLVRCRRRDTNDMCSCVWGPLLAAGCCPPLPAATAAWPAALTNFRLAWFQGKGSGNKQDL